jgi:oxygen-independent coproporphyrinogen-3 oxidase
MQNLHLTQKYNIPVPRYTSYPSVPNWSDTSPSQKVWFAFLNKNMEENAHVSLYIHLPYCEELCTYCACNKRITKNHKVETPYINTLLKEWNIYLQNLKETPIIQELHLGGGTPTFFQPNELERLLKGITQKVRIGQNPIFSFEAHPKSTTTQHLKVLRELGFSRISIGVQDIDAFILSAINRTQDTNQISNLTREARSLGYSSINYDIIYGLPFQKEENITKTVAYIESERPDRLAFYSYAHVPWKSKGQRAFDDEDVPNGNQKLKLKIAGEQLLKDIGYQCIGMDHFALPDDTLYKAYVSGYLNRNFMGFTEVNTRCLIGLGTSAISDCQQMYIQNEKIVEKYQDRINEGELAIIKGHQLSKDESIIRKHIMALMCNDSTSWENNSYEESILLPAINRLAEKIKEELIKVGINSLRVTPKGKPFVRNICADLDPYFASNKSLNFSKSI